MKIDFESFKDSPEAKRLENAIVNPSSILIAPLTPWLVFPDLPVTAALLLITVYDFFWGPGKLCKKYVHHFTNWYISVLVFSAILCILLRFFDPVFWFVSIVIGPFLGVFWAKFAWTSWNNLYTFAQTNNIKTNVESR